MGLCVRVVRGLALCLVLGGLLVGAAVVTVSVSEQAVAQTVGSIIVQGNRRVEADTIRSYFHAGPDGRLSPGQIDDGLKTLYSTGLFQDVRTSTQGGRVVRTPGAEPAR